jgi:spore coat polysaccharide biosynthesis protein SpsF
VKVVASIEARMGSSRLPGKNGRLLAGRPMLARLIGRLKASTAIDVICLATTTEPEDDRLVALARAEGIEVHRGSTSDVMGRVLGAAESVDADVVVEITGDCPLSDPGIIDAVVHRYARGGFDYVANILDVLTFPAGFDVQVFSRELLSDAAGLTADPQDREDVTRFFYRNPARYRLLNLRAPVELDRPQYWLCVDYPEDFALVAALYEELLPISPLFSARQIIDHLDRHPALAASNTARDGLFSCPHSDGSAVHETLTLAAVEGTL